MKRVVDVVGAMGMMVLTAPLLVGCALWVWLRAGRPVFFRQTRLGRGGILFRCLKFRTMRVGADEWLARDPALRARYVSEGFKLAVGDDPRIVPATAWLRVSGLDELPQLFNVLRGDMSLVGPRPIIPEEAERYGAHLDTLLSVRPGLTGPWVVAPGPPPYPERAAIELRYARSRTLGVDLRVTVQTVLLVLKRSFLRRVVGP